MASKRLLVLLSLTMVLQYVTSVCVIKSEPKCVHFYGRTFNYQEADAKLMSTQVVETKDEDPTPCCSLCYGTIGCAVYDFEFNNGSDAVCKLYSLPNKLFFDYAYTNFVRYGNGGRCIGFSFREIRYAAANDY